jgi:hypothetical protein
MRLTLFLLFIKLLINSSIFLNFVFLLMAYVLLKKAVICYTSSGVCNICFLLYRQQVQPAL